MGGSTGKTLAIVAAIAFFAFPSVSGAAEPPNPNDPCSRAGRDTCGTLGVGFYRTYRYGLRWFGDFRGAIPGKPHTFCLDLRYWYASRDYRYRPATGAALRNREGRLVPVENRRRIAYAIWRYGRSSTPARQAAVMLYVHAQMGDARPGEVDPDAVGPDVASIYRRIARDTPRYHGPYRVETRLPGTLTVGRPAEAELRVLSAAGRPLPSVRLTLATSGATGTPAETRTNGSGVARVSLTPTRAEGVRLRVETEPLAAPQPLVYVPSTKAAARNGQRLAVPAAQPVSATATPAVQARPRLTTVVSKQLVRPGAEIFDRVRVEGLGSTPARIEVELFGPFGSRAAIRCVRSRLHWRGRISVAGEGEVRTPKVKLARAGFYGYRERLLGTEHVVGVTTPCAPEEETSLSVPRIVTGRGDVATPRVVRADGTRPVRVRLGAARIDAPVRPVGIDVKHGVLGIPADIDRVGWWRDGAAPGEPRGAVLVAGHVDSARHGPGAFFRLGRASRGDTVRLETAGGDSFAYRVAAVRSYPKGSLPSNVFSRAGRARLVLVTCGGPFDEATGHYRDVVVVTAFPAAS